MPATGTEQPKFFCQLKESRPHDLPKPPADENPEHQILIREIEKKIANPQTNSIHKTLLKDKNFRNYIISKVVSLESLPNIKLNHVSRYTNPNILRLVLEKKLDFTKIATLSPQEYDQARFSVFDPTSEVSGPSYQRAALS